MGEEKNKGQVKNNRRKQVRDANGITLVALVITIIIIIILSTVTINMAFGDNGLIKQAELARDLTANSMGYETQATSNLVAYMNEMLEGSGDIQLPTNEVGGTDPEEPEPDPVPETDGSFSSEEGVNTPDIGPNMQLVVFDSNTNTWIEDTTKEAYSYLDTSIPGNENKSEWANAKVTTQVNGQSVESYFVWIPRFAYKITYYTDSNKTTLSNTPTAYGTIDVKFIKGIGEESADGITICKYADDPTLNTSTDYIIHPAFTKNADLGGGWSTELAGIWIGKYEASSVEGNRNTVQGDNVTTKHVKIQPGVSSWRYIQIGNIYTVSQDYAPDLKSHMLKNSEWGAVAYLTESKYGMNGQEVSLSNNGSTYYTGGGTGNAYIINTPQSSTGNVYGIYDLVGNAYEYVAGYYQGGDFKNANSAFADGSSDEYSTAYVGSTVSTAYKYGDATYETNGWHGDNSMFIDSEYPFFNRGGVYSSGDTAPGIFFYTRAMRQ